MTDGKELKARGGESTKLNAGRGRLRHFSRSLPMSLLRAREAVMTHFRAGLRHFGITEQQWRVLRALASIESIEILGLAEATFLLPPSLSRILKDLHSRGLIVRRTSDSDLRRGLVSISESGLRLIEQAGIHSEVIYDEITRRYGADRLAVLQDMLRDLEATMASPILNDLPPVREDAGKPSSQSRAAAPPSG